MNQHEARTRELQQLLYAATEWARPTTERKMCYRRFRDICSRYNIDPSSIKIPRTPPGPRKVRKLPTPPPSNKPTKAQPPGPDKRKTVHSDCTHPNTKVARSKCRRHREKAEQLAKEAKKS